MRDYVPHLTTPIIMLIVLFSFDGGRRPSLWGFGILGSWDVKSSKEGLARVDFLEFYKKWGYPLELDSGAR